LKNVQVEEHIYHPNCWSIWAAEPKTKKKIQQGCKKLSDISHDITCKRDLPVRMGKEVIASSASGFSGFRNQAR
jgi:hypothetical protein